MVTPTSSGRHKERHGFCDPVTGLPIVMDASACASDAKAEATFERIVFSKGRQQEGLAVVLFFGWILRRTARGKLKRRILLITRNTVLVTYGGEAFRTFRHRDAVATRRIPIYQIQKLLLLPKKGIVIHVAPKDSVVMPSSPRAPPPEEHAFDLELQCGAAEQEVVNILKRCYAAACPGRSLSVISDPNNNAVLKKPKAWSGYVGLSPNDIPFVRWDDARRGAVRLVPSASTISVQPSVEEPVEMELEEAEWDGGSDDESDAYYEDDDSDGVLGGAADLCDQITALRARSSLLSAQQKLHMTTLESSQQLVAQLLNSTSNAHTPTPPPLALSPLSPPPPPSLPPPVSPHLSHLERRLCRVQSAFQEEMAAKDREITELREALEGVLADGAGENAEKENEEEEPRGPLLPQAQLQLRSSVHPAYEETEESRSDMGNSGAESETQRIADAHTRSIQTRRREVEQLLRQLEVLERSGRHGDSANDIQQLRSQLGQVMVDLEHEALSYQDGLLTGLPVPTLSRSSPTPQQLRSIGGGGVTNLPPLSPRSKQNGDPTADWHWANYSNYLATYYPSTYAQYYVASMAGQQPAVGY